MTSTLAQTAALARAFANSEAATLDAAVIATLRDGVIAVWNRGAEQLYGWRASEVIGRNVVEVTPSEPSQADASEILAALAAGRPWQGEFPVRRRDGSAFEAFVVDTPVTAAHGELSAIVGVSGPAEARAAVSSANLLLWHSFRRRTGDVWVLPEAAPSAEFLAAPESKQAAAYYRCYILDSGDRFAAVREGFFDSDDEALDFARSVVRRFAASRGAEVWQGGRAVGRVSAGD